MKTAIFRIPLLFFMISFFLCLGPATAGAKYDKAMCKKSVGKLVKLVKPHKDVKFKSLLADIKTLGDKDGGMATEEIKAATDVPFKDLKWTKKFIQYLESVEQDCAK